jgi:hypothetical protein
MPSTRSRLSSRPRKAAKSLPARQGETALDEIADPVELAKLTLQAICRDLESPAAARAQAARTLLELSGALKNGSQNEARNVLEMSASELDARLEALASQARADTPV